MADLRPGGEVRGYEDGSAVVRRGEPGTAFYVVLAGAADVRLVGEGGRELLLRRLGPGAFFGEMSVLTGDPVSADVIASGHATLLVVPGQRLSLALSESHPLRDQVLASLVHNLRGVSTDAWNFFQRAEALNVLLDSEAPDGALVAESKAARRVADGIARLARTDDPVLLLGEAGTGKRFAASKIAEGRTSGDAPFIVVDCRRLTGEEACRFLFGSSRIPAGAGGEPESNVLFHYGALHLASKGTLVLRHIEALEPAAQALLFQYLQRLREGSLAYPVARVIATAEKALTPLAAEGRFHPGLAERLSSSVLDIPPLRDRKKDILPLVRHFLADRSLDQEFRVSDGAKRVLVSRRYSHANVAELREAVDLAALFADGGEILAEHIFTGPKEQGTPLECDLGQVPWVGRLVGEGALRWARAAVLACFSAVVLLCLLFPRSHAGVAANFVIWGAWEPALIAAFLFVGRVWCTVCPLSTAGRLAARLARTERPPPAWLKQYSAWLLPLGFLAIVWWERAFHTASQPTAAALLLVFLLAGQVLCSLLFARETWCRYLCPMGGIGAVYSLPAPIGVRASPDVCSAFCTTHDCHNGNAEHPGCPVFHHPLYARDAHACKLCLQCLTSCPHGSARLYLRPPFLRIWRQTDLGGTLSLFALVVFFLSPVLLAAQRTAWVATTTGFAAAAAIAAGLAALYQRYLVQQALRRAGDPAVAFRAAFALLVLAWGPAMAYQLGNAPFLSAWELRSSATALGALAQGSAVPVLTLCQVGVMAVAASLSAVVLLNLRGSLLRAGIPLAAVGWKGLVSLCVLYQGTALALLRGNTYG